jgi:(E)-4-hydroxy-3-methylbut-2-enyl-diphosphate synthase
MTTMTRESGAPAQTVHPFLYRRRRTRVVMVGEVAVGGNNPIRVQSMTTTRTQDVEATAVQAERLVRAGCEIVRITAPTVRDAKAIGEVRAMLRGKGITVPLVADIHFSPEAALAAADFVEKVRINPGNYADSRKFAVREYTDAEYVAELARIEERVTPLILKLKERGVALRIGTNHGSLSDRITNRYGDTPRGMVESALEFVRICEKNNFHDIILSMKASNPKVMIEAYRLLDAAMAREDMDYPFHLGVTEAGNGEDARIKSAAGIGALLLDGIGDTIRVSLAEEPEEEIPVARALAAMLPSSLVERGGTVGIDDQTLVPSWDPLSYARRRARAITLGGTTLGGDDPVAVLAPAPSGAGGTGGRALPMAGGMGGLRRAPRADAVLFDVHDEGDLERLAGLAWKGAGKMRTALVARGSDSTLLARALEHVEAVYVVAVGLIDFMPLIDAMRGLDKPLFVEAASVDPLVKVTRALTDAGQRDVAVALSVAGDGATPTPLAVLHGYRLLVARLHAAGLDAPIYLRYVGDYDAAQTLIHASAALGALLCDGLGDVAGVQDGAGQPLVPLTFNLLQATGRRITKTDYVACPSCGRTLFDLQSTTDKIKERTAHLVGVKIAVMGCVVNGPGEMADADFGYVGGAPGKVNLYVGKETVERNVPEAEAADRLVALIKARGRWVEATDDTDEGEDAPALSASSAS